jgi:hypothetical protein
MVFELLYYLSGGGHHTLIFSTFNTGGNFIKIVLLPIDLLSPEANFPRLPLPFVRRHMVGKELK